MALKGVPLFAPAVMFGEVSVPSQTNGGVFFNVLSGRSSPRADLRFRSRPFGYFLAPSTGCSIKISRRQIELLTQTFSSV